VPVVLTVRTGALVLSLVLCLAVLPVLFARALGPSALRPPDPRRSRPRKPQCRFCRAVC